MLKLKDFDFEKTEVNINKIKQYTSEDNFMILAVEIFKEIGKITTVISCTYKIDKNNKPRKWTRDEAILGGLMVRLNKLQISFLDQVCQKRMETGMILLRCISETLININYLLEKNSEELSNKFIEYSLREEKRLLNKINKNIKERGQELPIEKRMKISIKKAFDTSNFKPEDVDETNRQSWEETIYKRAKIIGMEEIYFYTFSLPCHDIHGNWQNLIINHLEYENGEFAPNTDWSMPRPQVLFAICTLSANTNRTYVEKTLPDCPDRDEIKKILDDISLRAQIVDRLHEQYLQKNKRQCY